MYLLLVDSGFQILDDQVLGSHQFAVGAVFGRESFYLILKSLDFGLEPLKEVLFAAKFVRIHFTILDGSTKHFTFSGFQPAEIDVVFSFEKNLDFSGNAVLTSFNVRISCLSQSQGSSKVYLGLFKEFSNDF